MDVLNLNYLQTNLEFLLATLILLFWHTGLCSAFALVMKMFPFFGKKNILLLRYINDKL
jgi:hypothetical protein